ncbi:hypothetical protein NLY43_15030 [Mesorhizobium sp. C416B]|uniref:hypothetical protein n=1 Tax=unclassified Mesorhizobium TaxID=325217 RepID=UPI0003CE615F|nr:MULTISPECIES: hypothetical protein [unclassified Mesorhizobium]ESX43588.1 hypothetical protein X762_27470 [Mesorhizobium sp. LSHC426A00]WJI65879.1 hypothetical protein NLY43_15030 [Mesorhizobium sp. C416B]
MVAITNSISGTTAAAFCAFFDRAGGCNGIAGRQFGDEGVDRRLQFVDDGGRQHVANEARTVIVGMRLRRHTVGCSRS